jgi:hypothetical protein
LEIENLLLVQAKYLVKLHKEAEVDLHGEGGLIHLEPIFTDVEILFDYIFVENVNITA